ncbi:MAG: uncharacterized protein QOJ99_2392 [Bryobacterales bacterium]|nr:uncharacterized protein [Bryobacterales bacterium]
MTLAELQLTERERILAIAHRHGATSVKVFGSFVRNEARQDSDLDLLIEARPNTSLSSPAASSPTWKKPLAAKSMSWKTLHFTAICATASSPRPLRSDRTSPDAVLRRLRILTESS